MHIHSFTPAGIIFALLAERPPAETREAAIQRIDAPEGCYGKMGNQNNRQAPDKSFPLQTLFSICLVMK